VYLSARERLTHAQPRTKESGDVKGTITRDIRYSFASNDIRRHRFISMSYSSLLSCHCSVQRQQTTDCESVENHGFAGLFGNSVCELCARF
jgi:hypothetical protein